MKKKGLCRNCGKEYEYECRGNPPLYCSNECRRKWRNQYKLRLKWKDIEKFREHDRRYHNRKNEEIRRNGIFVKYDGIDRTIQKVMDLELYPFQLKRVEFKIKYSSFPRSYNESKVKRDLAKIDSLNLSTEYLSTHDSYDY